PENGAGLPSNGKVYFSSLYKASVIEYDPLNNTYREFKIPGISGNPMAHVSGIEASKWSSDTIWAIIDPAFVFATNGANMTGPDGLVSINITDQSMDIIYLKPVLERAQSINGGTRVVGAQDLVQAPDGSVYLIISFGQAIIKIVPQTRALSVFYSPKPAISKISYTGIELVSNHTLVVWNTAEGRFETFEINSPEPKAKFVKILNSKSLDSRKIYGDALFGPSFAQGRCLLLSNPGAKTIEVFTSNNGWNSATHRASIDASRHGGFPSFTYETLGKIYFGLCVSCNFSQEFS
ncbi:hypothetical protein BY996DRAFT_4597977, partial [Phakopsora pachyrhizi]